MPNGMTQIGQHSHYNVKFLKGYGFSVCVKNNKLVLKNNYDPFKEPEREFTANTIIGFINKKLRKFYYSLRKIPLERERTDKFQRNKSNTHWIP